MVCTPGKSTSTHRFGKKIHIGSGGFHALPRLALAVVMYPRWSLVPGVVGRFRPNVVIQYQHATFGLTIGTRHSHKHVIVDVSRPEARVTHCLLAVPLGSRPRASTQVSHRKHDDHQALAGPADRLHVLGTDAEVCEVECGNSQWRGLCAFPCS